MLKSVFKMLKHTIEHSDMNRLPTMVLACYVLHNIHLSLYADEPFEEGDNRPDYVPIIRSMNASALREYRHALSVRRTLVSYLHTLPLRNRGQY